MMKIMLLAVASLALHASATSFAGSEVRVSDGNRKIIAPDGSFNVNGHVLGHGRWLNGQRFAVKVQSWGNIWWVGDVVSNFTTFRGMMTAAVHFEAEVATATPRHWEAGSATAPVSSTYFLAPGGRSCTSECTHRGSVCDSQKVATAASSLPFCRSLLTGLGMSYGRSGTYHDDNAGCTYHPGQTGWAQIMQKPSNGPQCDVVNADRSRQRVCACAPRPTPAPTPSTSKPICVRDCIAATSSCCRRFFRFERLCTVNAHRSPLFPGISSACNSARCPSSGCHFTSAMIQKTSTPTPTPTPQAKIVKIVKISSKSGEWWSPSEVTLSASDPVTITYEVRPDSATSECIGAFSHNMKRWGSGGEDALTWYGAPHRKDFAFRLGMFKGFPRQGDSLSMRTISSGVWHRFKVTLLRGSASYSVDGHHFATMQLRPGDAPAKGYVGMIRYASDYSFRNMVIRDATGEVVYPPRPFRGSGETGSSGSGAKPSHHDAAKDPRMDGFRFSFGSAGIGAVAGLLLGIVLAVACRSRSSYPGEAHFQVVGPPSYESEAHGIEVLAVDPPMKELPLPVAPPVEYESPMHQLPAIAEAPVVAVAEEVTSSDQV